MESVFLVSLAHATVSTIRGWTTSRSAPNHAWRKPSLANNRHKRNALPR